jgi:hypothetical protein
MVGRQIFETSQEVHKRGVIFIQDSNVAVFFHALCNSKSNYQSYFPNGLRRDSQFCYILTKISVARALFVCIQISTILFNK